MKIILLAILAIALPAAAIERSSAAKRTFARAHPCPATGKPATSCPGYVIDHIQPLCGGGSDTPANMQWQTVKRAKVKDTREVKYCACLRAEKLHCRFSP